MAQKTFYIDLEKQKFNETMIVNKQISFNHMVRKRGRRNPIRLLDNHSSVSTVYIKKKVKKWQPFHLNKLQLQHPDCKIFRCELNLASKTYGTSNQNNFDSFWNIYKNLASNPNKKYPVMILRAIRGGYLGYSFNIVAYIPQDQYQLSRKSYFSHSTLFTPNKKKSPTLSAIEGKIIFKHIPHRLPFVLRSENQLINESDSNFSMKNPPEKTDASSINFIFIHYQEQGELQKVKKIEKLENNIKEILLETETYEQKNKNKK